MLLELRVENLLLIDRAELRLGDGLNAVTGETGAGKTVLAHALDLLLGGKPRPGIVRPGVGEAYVEGVFAVDDGLLDCDELADLRERLPEELDEIVLGRRVSAEGRTRAFVQGRSASAADLRELGGRLLSFYGQHEHRKLTLSSAQLEILDGFCGTEHLATRERYAAAHARVRSVGAELQALRTRAGARDRDRDLLAFELEEIDALAPSVEEEERLATERTRLGRLDALRAAAAAGAEALAPEHADAGTASALAEAERLADAVAGADAELDALAERLRALRIESEDLGADLRRYAESLGGEPGGRGGVPAPLRETASGGELSRAMLALLSAARAGGDTTLVFDEVDAGIGGQTARAVGERLRALAENRQVICITHLPQIASLARRHFRIAKEAEGELARTSVEALEETELVGELCRMLGADTSDDGAVRHAEELLAAA